MPSTRSGNTGTGPNPGGGNSPGATVVTPPGETKASLTHILTTLFKLSPGSNLEQILAAEGIHTYHALTMVNESDFASLKYTDGNQQDVYLTRVERGYLRWHQGFRYFRAQVQENPITNFNCNQITLAEFEAYKDSSDYIDFLRYYKDSSNYLNFFNQFSDSSMGSTFDTRSPEPDDSLKGNSLDTQSPEPDDSSKGSSLDTQSPEPDDSSRPGDPKKSNTVVSFSDTANLQRTQAQLVSGKLAVTSPSQETSEQQQQKQLSSDDDWKPTMLDSVIGNKDALIEPIPHKTVH